jgi:predicted ATP-binding protein involved in virulence
MELVYLWVKEYKNIRNQGFNFSPRFRCSYDGKNLTIDENKNYIDVFPKNINITAIVGENGSGKSNILEAISETLSKSHNKADDFLDEEYRQYILIYEIDKKYFFFATSEYSELKMVDAGGKKITWINKNPNTDSFIRWHKNLVSLIIDNQLKQERLYEEYNNIFVENTQFSPTKIKKIIVSNVLKYKNVLFKKEAEKFFVPEKISIKINNFNLYQKDEKYYDEETWKKITNKQEEMEENLSLHKHKEAFKNILEVLKIKQFEHKKIDFLSIDKDGSISVHDSFNLEKTYHHKTKINPSGEDIYNIHSSVLNKLKRKKLNKNILFEWEIDELNDSIIDFIFDLPEIAFDFELKDSIKRFEDLSYGEKQLLTQLNFILHYSNKRTYTEEAIEILKDENNNELEYDKTLYYDINNMIILLDEFELGLHPNWQKQSIAYLVDFLKLFKINFHIITTSHSPFILSDLPKENVIFLEKGEQVYPEINTFGANIHTLLSHGFFMKDGLMGEFAKSKIDEIKKSYELIQLLKNRFEANEKTKELCRKAFERRKTRFRNIQNMIGEPFLQTIIKNYLDEFEQIFHNEEFRNRKKENILKQFTTEELKNYLDKQDE